MSTAVSPIDEIKTNAWSGGKSPLAVEYGKLMMWFFLLSDAFTFSAFLIYYGAQRFSKLTWPDPDVIFQSIPGIADSGYPLVFVGLMTFILIMSSVTMVLAVEAGHRKAKKEVIGWMIATVVGGLMAKDEQLCMLSGSRVDSLTPRRILVGPFPGIVHRY